MRSLLLMRGAPGAGKSTWIKENNLEQYTLSPDTIRVMCSSLELQADGDFKISQDQRNETEVWSVLFKLLEHRMSRGEFTVIDATCSKTADIKQYKDLADQYRYRMYIVDFTDIPLETCLAQNKLRPEWKQVPNESIRKIYARFATQKIPSGVKLIKRDELSTLLEQPIDLSNYSKIVFIGDIHGCYNTLMQYPDFKEGLKDDVEYIFLGDLIDRGNQNAEVLEFIASIKDKPNVCLLEGNHDKNLQYYGTDAPAKSKEFEQVTRKELIKKEFSKKTAREIYRKVRQFSHFTYNGLEILACHGGIPTLATNLMYLPTKDFIRGVGTYEDYLTIADTWMQQTKENQYLIHGHRNIEASPIDEADRVFNLEGRVEFGGKLRIVELTKDLNWNYIYLDSIQPILNIEEDQRFEELPVLEKLRADRFVQEKDLGNDVSSFNFTREAFYEKNWNTQTILARGLFLNNKTGDVVARSYEKFFRINETRQTELASLKEKLVFPIKAYLKENGFLGIVSYLNDDLFIASKSTNKGDYVEYFKTLLDPYKEKLLGLFRNKTLENVSLVFEVIDINNDPHIIKYDKSQVVLLDIIENNIEFKKFKYEQIQKIASIIGCKVKKLSYILNNWNDFKNLYLATQEYNYKYNNNYIEGFVFEDLTGFMVKVKTEYYNEWKKLRTVSIMVLKCGYLRKTGMLLTELENYFYGFLRDLYKNYYNKEEKTYPFKIDIISLREYFEEKTVF